MQIERHFANLVEQDRAAIGQFEFARTSGDRTGECASPMTEEFAFEQSLRNRGAVDGDERLAAAVAGIVNEARQQLLAGSALGFDQHIGAGAGCRASALQRPQQQRRLADDCAGRSVPRSSAGASLARCITCAAVACN